MTLQQLQYFQALAEILHYTNAAKKLHISQPSLSYAISELEKELGVPLFIKDNKKISLTPYGKVFLDYINKALNTIQQGIQNLASMKSGIAGTVSIGYIYSLSTTLIPQIVEGFKAHSQNDCIKFKFMQNLHIGLIEALKNKQIDLAISGDTNDSIISIPLMEQELFLVVSNKSPLAKKDSVYFKDIVKEPYVLLDQDSGLRALINQEFSKLHVTPNVLYEAHECSAALQYVAHNSGITIMPHTPGVDYLPVKQIKILTPGFKRQIYLSCLELPPSRTVRKVIDFILNSFSLPSL